MPLLSKEILPCLDPVNVFVHAIAIFYIVVGSEVPESSLGVEVGVAFCDRRSACNHNARVKLSLGSVFRQLLCEELPQPFVACFLVRFLEARIRFLAVRDPKVIFVEDLWGQVQGFTFSLDLSATEIASVGSGRA